MGQGRHRPRRRRPRRGALTLSMWERWRRRPTDRPSHELANLLSSAAWSPRRRSSGRRAAAPTTAPTSPTPSTPGAATSSSATMPEMDRRQLMTCIDAPGAPSTALSTACRTKRLGVRRRWSRCRTSRSGKTRHSRRCPAHRGQAAVTTASTASTTADHARKTSLPKHDALRYASALVSYIGTSQSLYETETRFRHRLRLDTYGHYPEHTEAVSPGARRRAFDGRNDD